MIMTKKTIVLAVCSAALFVSAPVWAGSGEPGHGHGHVEGHHDEGLAFGEPGDAGSPSREIAVVMKETDDGQMLFAPNKIAVKKGEQIRFMLKNEGELDHEIVVATLDANMRHAEQMAKHPDMEHDDPNAKRLVSGASGEILWKFTNAGTFDFSCLIPGHRESGMSGSVTVN